MTQITDISGGAARTSDTRIISLVCSAHFVSHFYILLLPPLFPFIREFYGVSYTELGFALTAFNVTTALCQTPAGFLADRIGPRPVLVSGLVLGAAAFATVGLVPSFWLMVAMFAVAGVANAVYHPANYAILSQLVSNERAGQAFSMHIFAGFLGTAVAPATLLIAQGWLGWGLVPSLTAGIGVGLAIGAIQGGLTAYLNIPAFIVTLGGLLAWRGVVLGLSRGETIPLRLQAFKSIGQDYVGPLVGWIIAAVAVAAIVWMTIARNRARRRHGLGLPRLWMTVGRALVPSFIVVGFIYMMNSYELAPGSKAGVPNPVIIFLAIALAGAFLTQNTTFGRYLYAIGGNPDAARLSGINIRKHVLAVFCIMGALAGVASIIYTARVGSASPDAGQLLELDAIAACVIGGTSLMGGRGTVFGAILGALIMASLDNGMSLKNVEPYMQNIIKGAILVAAVGLDMAGRKRS